jgi:hypothetical protein
MGKTNVFAVLLLLAGLVHAGSPGVRVWATQQNLETTYDSVYKSLEEKRFFVVFEPNIGQNLARFSGRWGEDYNRNALSGIRSMVFCNAWYANQVSNLDPDMLALCPLHVTLYGRDSETRVVFVRPGYVGEGSEAKALLQELEEAVAAAIETAIKPPAP